MMTESEYFYAWMYYMLGAALLIACWWYATRKIPWVEVKYLLRIIVSVAILVPWYTNSQQLEYLSPALLIAVLETAFEGSEAFWRAGKPLLTAITSAVGLSTLIFLARWVILRRKTASVS